jgi:hypothetical protein
MAASYRIDERQRCVFVTLDGAVDDWELGRGAQRLLADPQFDPEFSRLVDATELSIPTTLPPFVESVASELRSKSAGKVALVGGSDEVVELLTAYRDNLQGVNCRVFQDMKAARQWLNISDDPLKEES